jgi:hypothetical protein
MHVKGSGITSAIANLGTAPTAGSEDGLATSLTTREPILRLQSEIAEIQFLKERIIGLGI